MSAKRVLSRHEVEDRISRDEVIVIYEGHALKLNAWLPYHPGGDKAVLHLVGRDGTDEMTVYHSDETQRRMLKFSIGQVELPWKDFLPPIQGGKFRSQAEIQADEALSLSEEEEIGKISPQDEFLIPDNADITMKVIRDYDDAQVKADLEKYPNLDVETQQHIKRRFKELHRLLEEKDLFRCTYWGYVREFSRITLLFTLSRVFFKWARNEGSSFSMLWLGLSALCMGLAWHQITFIVHDGAHLAITHNYYIDSIFSVLLADYVGGLSAGWWKRNHNVHHIVTNDPVHDPDIQHLPFFAVSVKFFGNVWSTFYEKRLWWDAFAKKLIPFQHYTYHLILCFGRFNLYRLSWEYLLKNQGPKKGQGAFLRYVELAGLAFFAYWYFYILVTCNLHSSGERWLYVMVSHIATMPVHVQITLSHFGMSTSDLGLRESFPQRQMRTTMDVDCPPWLDFVHGGLQFQAVHHLFPRMPRHNFREAQKYVRDFCDELGLHYTIYAFKEGNEEVLSKMAEIGKQARILADCTKFCEKEAEEEIWKKSSDVKTK